MQVPLQDESNVVSRAQRDQLSRYLGPLESRIMEDVWSHGPSTVNDVLGRLNRGRGKSLVYNTVMSTLSRLADKGYLTRQRDGRAYVYQGSTPTQFLQDRAADATREMVDEFGSVAVAGIIDGLSVDDETRRRLAQLLESTAEG